MSTKEGQSYEQLEKRWTRIAALSDAVAMLSWDRQAIMPSASNTARADQIAMLSVLKHEEVTAPLIADLLEEADNEELSIIQKTNLQEMRRLYQHAITLSPDIVNAYSRACADCENKWQTARKENSFEGVKKPLGLVVDLTQEIATTKAQSFQSNPYDSLLDEYEPGGSSKRIDAVFNILEPALQKLLPEVIEYQANTNFPSYSSPVSTEKQKNLGLKIMQSLGFDFSKGRLDTSIHPFSGGTPDDVRITTRYDEDDWTGSLMGVIHETGHALYEQGLPIQWRGQPVGAARGMVLHESQSLLMEMQACRSSEFYSFLAPLIATEFSVEGNQWTPEALSRNSRRIVPNFIRVDADELTYPLHVILRYKLERALLGGDLVVSDLPYAWNDAFESSFGIRPPDDLRGCLQDIHWYDGAIGYFPTYTLGALAAAQLFASLVKDHPDVLTCISKGDFSVLLGWLRTNIHNLGSAFSTDEIMLKATGKSLSEIDFLTHLNKRYLSGD
jgi:carboxypeptidase Taq